jgi:hypothetical protein
MIEIINHQKALLVLGCPQVPTQTAAAMYLAYKLKKTGIIPVIAANPAARMLMKYADPEKHYIDELHDLDKMIGDLVEKRQEFSLCFVFVHNDSGLSYAASMNIILNGGIVIPVIFGKEIESLKEGINFECSVISARAEHNPKPLINAMESGIKWDV